MATKFDLELIQNHFSWGSSVERDILVGILQSNGVAITATDTIYGFLANCTKEGYEKIFDLKHAVVPRPFLLLISSLEKLSYFVDETTISSKTLSFLKKCWPGPLTVIFKAKKDLPEYFVSTEGMIALRCPDHIGLQAILPHFQGLFSTSANRSKDRAPEKISDVVSDLLQKVDCIVTDDDKGRYVTPSTIVDCSKKDGFTIVRQGAYSSKTLKEIYEKAG